MSAIRITFKFAAAVLVALSLCWPVYPARAGDRQEEASALSAKLKTMAPPQQLEYLHAMVGTAKYPAVVFFYIGNTHYTLSQIDSAVSYFRKATDVDPTYYKAYVNMGIALDGVGQGSAARTAYEKAIAANPDDVLAYCHLGYNYFARGKGTEAMKYYLKALEIDPNSAQAHYNLGLAFADAKVFNEALIEWRKVIELDPDGDLGRIAGENVELIKTYLELEQ